MDKSMDTYVERIKHNAEHLAKETFPKMALELDELINSTTLSTSSMCKVGEKTILPKPEDFLSAAAVASGNSAADLMKVNLEKENLDEMISHQPKKRKHDSRVDEVTGTKVILFPGGGISTNQAITDLLKLIKPFIIHFLDSSASLKLWIQILIPQVEDFKAELSLAIQEESLSEIRTVEAEVATYLDHIYKYHAVRGKLVLKLAKFPHVVDFRQSILELDEKMFMTIRLIALELRNHYTSLHDMLIKNMEKIKKPRSNQNHIAMY